MTALAIGSIPLAAAEEEEAPLRARRIAPCNDRQQQQQQEGKDDDDDDDVEMALGREPRRPRKIYHARAHALYIQFQQHRQARAQKDEGELAHENAMLWIRCIA